MTTPIDKGMERVAAALLLIATLLLPAQIALYTLHWWHSETRVQWWKAQSAAIHTTTITPMLLANITGGERDPNALAPEDINANDWLHAAVQQVGLGTDCLRLLLERGGDPNDVNSEGLTPLHVLARFAFSDSPRDTSNTQDAIDLLVAAGANMEATDSEGRTPLHGAVGLSNLTAATLLLDRGANVDARDSEGSTPLTLAVCYGDKPTAELLLAHDANPNARDNTETTILRTAMLMRTINDTALPIIRILLEAGADPNALGSDKRQPLAHAIFGIVGRRAFRQAYPDKAQTKVSADLDLIKLLLEHGAKINLAGAGGTVLDIASAQSGLEDVVAFLSEQGAEKSASATATP